MPLLSPAKLTYREFATSFAALHYCRLVLPGLLPDRRPTRGDFYGPHGRVYWHHGHLRHFSVSMIAMVLRVRCLLLKSESSSPVAALSAIYEVLACFLSR